VNDDSKVEGIFSFVPADIHLSGGLTSAPGFYGLSSTPGPPAQDPARREAPPKDMNFHSHRIILSIKLPEGGADEGVSFQRDLPSRFFCADELASSVPVTKIRMRRIEKSIEKKRIARGILRR